MPKSILIRSGQSGNWVGYAQPMPKMPTPDSVREWKDFETMVQALKNLNLKVTVTNDELIIRLKKHGIEAHKPATPKKKAA